MAALRNLILAFSLVAACSTSSTAAISFIYPGDKTFVTKSNYLVVKLNSTEATGVRININNIEGDLFDVGGPEYRRAFRDFVIVQPVWDPGRNVVTVISYKDGKQLETASATIYYLSGRAASVVPPEYREFVMHTVEQEKICAACHNMNPTATQAGSPDERENPCYGCHKKILDARYVHGPAGTASCVYCHNLEGLPRYAAKKREQELCIDCHGDKVEEFRKKKYLHGPIAAGMCEICHDPHGSSNRGHLRQPVNQLCLSCHGQIEKQPHVARTTVGKGHPLSGKPDPSKSGSGRQLSCISCHQAHGGDVRYFFLNDAPSRMELCQICHNK